MIEKNSLTRNQFDDLVITYEEAKSKPRRSGGAWHTMLIAKLRELGSDTKYYDHALSVAKEIYENPKDFLKI